MKVKVGLALVPELAQKADASFQFQCTPLLPLLPLLPSTVHADKADLTLLNKTYSATPEPLLSVFKLRTVVTVLGRNFVGVLIPWMNEFQGNLEESMEENEEWHYEDQDYDVEVPPFKPVLKKFGIRSFRDFSVLFLKRIYEILASSVVEPRLASKLLKDYHSSAIRKQVRFGFEGLSLVRKLQVASSRVSRMTRTALRSACLGFLSEMTINEVVIVCRTIPSVRNDRDFEGEGEYEGEDALDYFQYHTFWNITRVSVRLVSASIGVGLGSLVAIGEPKLWPTAGKVGTIVGFAIGDYAGGKLVDTLRKNMEV